MYLFCIAVNKDTSPFNSTVVRSSFSSISQMYLSPLCTWLLLVLSSMQVVDQDVSKMILCHLNEVWGPSQWCGGSEDTSVRTLLSRHYSFCRGETTVLFVRDKSILGVVASLDSWSSSISADCWDDTFESSLGRYSWVMYFSNWYLEMILFSRYYQLEAENRIVSWCPFGVAILIRILSEALFIFSFISPEFIMGFYWL